MTNEIRHILRNVENKRAEYVRNLLLMNLNKRLDLFTNVLKNGSIIKNESIIKNGSNLKT